MKTLFRKLTTAFAVMFMVAGFLTVTSAPALATDEDCPGRIDLWYEPSNAQAKPSTGRVVDNGSSDFYIDASNDVVYFPINGYFMRGARAIIKPLDGSTSGRLVNGAGATGDRGSIIPMEPHEYLFQLHLGTDAPGCPQPGDPDGVGGAADGYWLLGQDGGIFTFGNAEFFGSTGAMKLNCPVNGLTATPSGRGYWFVACDGGVFSFGDARFWGSTGAMKLNQPVVGMTRTQSGNGYWLVATDGGIFNFGDAKFHGSTGAMKLNQPIVGMTATPSGNGYMLVARDGGIFTFGDAKFFGSLAGLTNSPVVSVQPTPSGNGYWILTAEGRVYPFGDAKFWGDNPQTRAPMVDFAVAEDGNGYWLTNAVGDVFVFGAAGANGGLTDDGVKPAFPIVGMDATAPA